MDQYFCDHAMAACRECKITYYSMCSHYYGANAYRASYMKSIYPVRDRKQWHGLEDVSSRIILPPSNTHKLARRPKKLRIPSQGEEIIVRRCSKYYGNIHDRARCKNQFFVTFGETSRPSGDGDV